MNDISYTSGSNNTVPTTPGGDTEQIEQTYLPTYLNAVFQYLETHDVEQFYKSYHLWSLQRRIETLYTEIGVLQQAITDNTNLMHQVHPSAIALASLAQLQANGINDLNLLDRMLERGEAWIDHTMQLLEQCEKLDLIRGDYTQWCENALEGAYDWVASIDVSTPIAPLENAAETLAPSTELNIPQLIDLQSPTEEQLLQKLMSDEEATDKKPDLHLLNETGQITTEIPARKITQPLEQVEGLIEADVLTKTALPNDGEPLELADSTNVEASTQIDEMKDIVEVPGGENEESVVQKANINPGEVEDAFKDADAINVKTVLEAPVASEEDPHRTETELVGMVVSQRKSNKLQHQQRQRGSIWHFIHKLLAFFYRKYS